MANQLRVRLVTPENILVDTDADSVEIPGKSGYVEVLYGHAPLLTEIGAGEVRLHGGDGSDTRYVVARGFAEVLPERVTILAESAEKPEDVDVMAAQEQYQRGQTMWEHAGEDTSKFAEANEMMAEATAKMESAGEKS